ncbi:Phosphoenolpyruvate/pyruvate domain-containing protein [Flagelloscypha sp. PMI_526]|nr:Phosphoenolpyruvate/pyruvate domain-containing protein [Flagelloscypha sp. PMI_526]
MDTKRFSMVQYRHKSLSFPHDVRSALRDAKENEAALLGYAMFSPSVHAARKIAPMGHDFVWVDVKHSATSASELVDIITAINYMSEGHSSASVRVPSISAEWTTWALDAGAGSIMFPRVHTAEDARRCVSLSTFSELTAGRRSVPPFRLQVGADINNFMDAWDNRVAIIVEIESMIGVSNIEDICQVERIDCIWINDVNLKLNIGLPKDNDKSCEADFLAAVEKVWNVADKYNKAKGGFAFGLARDQAPSGSRHYMMIASDMGHLFQDVRAFAVARERYQ